MIRLALALLMGLPGAAGAQDTGLEALSRREKTLGWEAVGRVDLGDQGFCTGTLIATDLVLTAAHCMYGWDDAAVDPGIITFRAGYGNGTAIAEVRVARFVVNEGYDPKAELNGELVRHDVALLQLEHPILAAVAAPFAVASPDDGDSVSVVSYAQGREEVLSWQRSCTVKGRGPGLIAFNCDVTFGASGAPIFDLSAGRARIVSIVSSGGRDGDAVLAFGMELPGVIREMKAALRAGRGVVEGEKAATGPQMRRLSAGDRSNDTGARFLKP
jgi:protease YdgD